MNDFSYVPVDPDRCKIPGLIKPKLSLSDNATLQNVKKEGFSIKNKNSINKTLEQYLKKYGKEIIKNILSDEISNIQKELKDKSGYSKDEILFMSIVYKKIKIDGFTFKLSEIYEELHLQNPECIKLKNGLIDKKLFKEIEYSLGGKFRKRVLLLPTNKFYNLTEYKPIKLRGKSKNDEHKIFQNIIYHWGKKNKYKAKIEAVLGLNKKSIDVLLEQNNRKIAYEISITTTPEMETTNVEKDFIAGVDEVVIISNNINKLEHIKKHFQVVLSHKNYIRVRFRSISEFL